MPSAPYTGPLPYNFVMPSWSDLWLTYITSFSQWGVSKQNQAEIGKVLVHFLLCHDCFSGIGMRTCLKYHVSGWEVRVLPDSPSCPTWGKPDYPISRNMSESSQDHQTDRFRSLNTKLPSVSRNWPLLKNGLVSW